MAIVFEYVSLDKLKALPRNAKRHDLGTIHQSMDRFSFLDSLVVNRITEHVLSGHGRIETLVQKRQNGENPPENIKADGDSWLVPVTWVDVPEKEEEAAALALNRTVELGGWNEVELAGILREYAETDNLDGMGWDADDVEGLLKKLDMLDEPPIDPGVKIDKAEELQEKWKVKRGDVWEIASKTLKGKFHKLMCGDCTKQEQVGILCDGKKGQLVFTDPPYGVDYDGGTTRREKLKGDTTTDLYVPCCSMAYKYSDEKAALYLWHAGVKGIAAAAAAAAAGYEIRCEIVWNKNQAQFGALSAQYKQKHEPLYYCFKKGNTPRWFGPTNEVTVWDCDRASVNEFHPTQKPPELACRAINNSSSKADIILDLFLGSGTTMVAAEQTGRVCYGMEIHPPYVAVTLQRMTEMGLTPKLENN